MKFYNTQTEPWRKFLILISVVVAMFCIGMGVAVAFVSLGSDLLAANDISSLIIFGGTAIVYCLLFEKKGCFSKMFSPEVSWKWVVTAILLCLVSMPMESVTAVDSDYNERILTMISDTSVWGLVRLIISMALLPAVLEELLFRGILQKLLIDWTKKVWVGILLASAIFSLVHADMPNFFARFILGVLLGLLYQYSGSLWINISFHFVNNLIAAIVIWRYIRGDIQSDNETFEWYFVILSFAMVLAFVVYNELKNKRSVRNNYIETDKSEMITDNSILGAGQ